jgi:hypothetical protein
MNNHWLGRIIIIVLAISAPLLISIVIGVDTAHANSLQALTYGVACIAVVGIEQRRRGGSAVASGLVPTPRSAVLSLLGAGWAIGVLALILLLAFVLGGRLHVLAEPSFSLTGLSTIVLFAIGEEVVFRGTLLEALHERFGAPAAVITTSILFALAHAGNPGASLVSTINVALAGIALGAAVITTSSLWMAIGFHVVWNVALSSVFGVVSGMDLGLAVTELNTSSLSNTVRPWIEGSFGIEEGYATTILLPLSMIALLRRVPYDPFVRAARFRRTFSS